MNAYETALSIAQVIAHCDYRVTVQKYVNRAGSPWVITVGESSWQRHLVIESASYADPETCATLGILDVSESEKFGYDIRTDKIVHRIELSELAQDYLSVKKALFPSKRESATV